MISITVDCSIWMVLTAWGAMGSCSPVALMVQTIPAAEAGSKAAAPPKSAAASTAAIMRCLRARFFWHFLSSFLHPPAR